MHAHQKNKKYHTSYEYCLGSYNCPEPGCKFKSWPRLPWNPSKLSLKNPLPPKNPCCIIHDTKEFVHIPCLVEMIVSTSIHVEDSHVKVKHIGVHNHPKPPPIRPTAATKKEFCNLVKNHPTTKPIALSTGANHRKAPHQIHPCYGNDDKMRSKRNMILKEEAAFHPSDLIAFERENKISFITASSVKGSNGCIIMQTDLMAQILRDSSNACQTDSIEGFVKNHHHPSVNVCVTSTYCPIRMSYYPSQFGILDGKSHEHYAFYFKALIVSMKFCDFADFRDNYLGKICDFSDAMRLGFCQVICDIFGLEDKECSLEAIYAICQVHFQRSTNRVQQNYEIVPSNCGSEFKWHVEQLLNVNAGLDQFQNNVDTLLSEFPLCKLWLNWYLHMIEPG